MSHRRQALKAKHQFLHQSGKDYQLKIRRTNQHMYVSIVDRRGHTLKELSTQHEKIRSSKPGADKKEISFQLGKIFGALIIKDLKLQPDAFLFNRNGILYHGRVCQVAQGFRESGIII